MTLFTGGSREGVAGSRDGAVVRAFASHQCVPGSISGPGVIWIVICGLSLLLVLFLAPRGFSPDTLVFRSPQKPAFPNSNLIWIIVKHFIMSLWLGWSCKHYLCLTLNLHLHLQWFNHPEKFRRAVKLTIITVPLPRLKQLIVRFSVTVQGVRN